MHLPIGRDPGQTMESFAPWINTLSKRHQGSMPNVDLRNHLEQDGHRTPAQPRACTNSQKAGGGGPCFCSKAPAEDVPRSNTNTCHPTGRRSCGRHAYGRTHKSAESASCASGNVDICDKPAWLEPRCTHNTYGLRRDAGKGPPHRLAAGRNTNQNETPEWIMAAA